MKRRTDRAAKRAQRPGRRCVVKSLGPSNDDNDAVSIEMRAAEIYGQGFGPMTEAEILSYRQRHDDANFTPDLDGLAGWLAFEIGEAGASWARPYLGAWDWDISRPLAAQLAETATDDAAGDDLVFTPCIEIVGDESDGAL